MNPNDAQNLNARFEALSTSIQFLAAGNAMAISSLAEVLHRAGAFDAVRYAKLLDDAVAQAGSTFGPADMLLLKGISNIIKENLLGVSQSPLQ